MRVEDLLEPSIRQIGKGLLDHSTATPQKIFRRQW